MEKQPIKLVERLNQARAEVDRLERELKRCPHSFIVSDIHDGNINVRERDHLSGYTYDVPKKVMMQDRKCMVCGLEQSRYFDNGWREWQ